MTHHSHPEKRHSSVLGLVTVLTLLTLGTVLWLGAAGTPVAAAVPPSSSAEPVIRFADVITIGVAADLSGSAAWLGWPEANAVQLAVDQVNAAGGLDIGGTMYSVVLVTADDQCDGSQSPLAAQALLDAGAVGVIGHTCSGATIPAEPIYAAAGVAMISPSSTNPSVTQQGYDITFRTCPHDGSPPAQLARYFRRGLGLERTSFVAFAGCSLGPSLWYSGTFTALAGTVTGFHQLANTADFTATLTAIKHDESPQAIYYCDADPARAGLFSRVAYGVGMDDVPIAWSPMDGDESLLAPYTTAAGIAVDGDVMGMEYRRIADMPGWPAFLAAYLAAGFANYGDHPTTFGPYAYDAAMILLTAIDRADSLDPAVIRDEIAATAGHVGVVGTYTGFDSSGDVVPQWSWLEWSEAGKWLDVEIYTWTDDFGAPTPGPLWSWVREDPTHWSLDDRPGFLRLTTQPGTLVGTGANDERNLLLMPAPPGDFYITAQLSFTPTDNYHQAGLIVYQDDDNYVRLSRAYVYDNYVELIAEIDGSAVVTGVAEAATSLTLQLWKNGDTYEGYYSLDGATWIPVGEVSAPLREVQAGLGASHDVEGPADIPADFDQFQIVGSLPMYDYGWADHFDKGLNESWWWVREDATHWSLDDRPDFMQITTQDGLLGGPGGDARNLLLRPTPLADYRVGTRIYFTPTQNFQIAGLLLYQGDDDYMLLGRAYCNNPENCVGNGIYFDHEENGGPIGSSFATAVALPYLAHLQVARAGSDYWGFYGEDGIYWTLVGRHVAGPGFVPGQAGLAAYNTLDGVGEIDADFDRFHLEADYLRAYLPVAVRNY